MCKSLVFLCNFRDLTADRNVWSPSLASAMLGLRLVSSVATMLVATMLGLRSTDEVALTGPKVELRKFARRFSSSVKVNGDIDVRRFVSAGEEFSHAVERFGDFTRRGVVDARKNLKRVEKAAGGRVVSMQVLLRDELRRGSRHPNGGPARSTGAEALLWSRLSVSFWVEIFKEHLRGKTSLPDATRSGFERSLARYLDRFSRAAFAAGLRQSTPDWEEVRRHTHLGCENGQCSDETLAAELKAFVREVEPVLDRMARLQKQVGLEDPRTP